MRAVSEAPTACPPRGRLQGAYSDVLPEDIAERFLRSADHDQLGISTDMQEVRSGTRPVEQGSQPFHEDVGHKRPQHHRFVRESALARLEEPPLRFDADHADAPQTEMFLKSSAPGRRPT